MLKSLDRFVNNITSGFNQDSGPERLLAGYNVPLVEDPDPLEGEETVVDGEHYWRIDNGSNKDIYLNGEEEVLIVPESEDERVIEVWNHNIQKWEENGISALSDFEADSLVKNGEEIDYGRSEYKENTPFFDLDREQQSILADDFVEIVTTYDYLHRNREISYSERPIQWDAFLSDARVIGADFETPDTGTNWIEYSALEDDELREELLYKLSEAVFKEYDGIAHTGRNYFDENTSPQEIAEDLTPENLEHVGIADDIVYDHEKEQLAIADYGEPGFINGEDDYSEPYSADEFLEAQNKSPLSALSD